MNHARAGELPVVPLPQTSWFRSVEKQYQYDPPHFQRSTTRFNPGNLRVIYFAPDSLLARFEARDVLGQWFGDATPSFRDRHAVVEYRIDLGPRSAIVDARSAQLTTVDTTVQEMTGDWHSYGLRGTLAPTQDLASAVFNRPDSPMGLIAPSAPNPLQNNLVLFADRLPPRSIFWHRPHGWHESQLSVRGQG